MKKQIAASVITLLMMFTTPDLISGQTITKVPSLNNQITAKIGRLSTADLESLFVQRQAEVQKISLTGRLEVIHVDDFKNPENSRYDYLLVVDNDRYTLYPTEPIPSASGAVISVSGSRLDKILVADSGQIRAITSAPRPDSVGEQKTLILLIKFLDSGLSAKTSEEINNLVFNGQFQKFYTEQSYGKVRFTGEVKGWYTLPRNNDCIDPSAPLLNNETAQLILDNNIDLSKYDRLVMAIDTPCGGGYSSVGKMNLSVGDKNFNLSVAWVQVSESVFSNQWRGDANGHSFPLMFWDFILDHEMGHSLGVLHANGWDCGENVLQGDCRPLEYGNYFDIMGNGFYALHFNALYKELLGWIPPSETLQINSSGRYTLNSLELANSSKKLAKIRSTLATSTTFYLEYRRGIGFDKKLNDSALASNQQGLFVNKIIYTSNNPTPFPRLLDMRPTTLSWNQDIAMATLNSTTNKFTDIGTGVSLGPIYRTSDSFITFDVEITEPQCVRNNPMIEYSNSVQNLIPSETGWAFIGYRNGDSSSCGNSNFRVKTNLPTTWQPIISPDRDVSISPDASLYKGVFINFIVPADIPTGTRAFTVEVTNLTTNYKTSKTFQVEIISPSVTASTLVIPVSTSRTLVKPIDSPEPVPLPMTFTAVTVSKVPPVLTIGDITTVTTLSTTTAPVDESLTSSVILLPTVRTSRIPNKSLTPTSSPSAIDTL